MTVLNNPKWEIFLRCRAEGQTIAESYLQAGYKVKNKEVALANGAAILRKPLAKKRLRELIDEHAENVIVTKESIAAELDAAAEQAGMLDQPSARIAAAVAKAKLFGVEAPSKTQVNINIQYAHLTDDELLYELAALVNEIKQIKGEAPIALPAPPTPTEEKDET